jgi:hypothetical protein
MTTTNTSALPNAHMAECERAHALLESIYAWTNDVDAQEELRKEVGRARGVPNWQLAHVHRSRDWYLTPNVSAHPTVAAYIDATRAALDAEVRAYQAKVAAIEAAERELRRAMREWRADPVGGRTLMVKDIARKHGATDHEMTRAYLRVHAGLLRPRTYEYQALYAYTAAWRGALVKELLAFRAMADHLFGVVRGRCFDEARFLRRNGGNKTHPKARALRAWRRNAERMQRNWARSL